MKTYNTMKTGKHPFPSRTLRALGATAAATPGPSTASTWTSPQVSASSSSAPQALVSPRSSRDLPESSEARTRAKRGEA
mgnify:CR=1 FL=1